MSEEMPRLHWHIGDGTRPPVDIEFAERGGGLAGVQVVLYENPRIDETVFGAVPTGEIGLPIADTRPWGNEKQIVEHVFAPIVAWDSSGVLSVRTAETGTPASKECLTDGLVVVTDAADAILGFRIRGLTSEQVALIRELELVDSQGRNP